MTVPAAIVLVELPSCPLQSMLVLDRMVQPLRLTTGAPLNCIATCEDACPASSVSMQALSGSFAATALTPTFMDGICMNMYHAKDRGRHSGGDAATISIVGVARENRVRSRDILRRQIAV